HIFFFLAEREPDTRFRNRAGGHNVAPPIPPVQTPPLDPSYVLGIGTMNGGKTSHSAIMARAMGIPLVSGLESNLNLPVQTGDMMVVDGDLGKVYVDPEKSIIDHYTALRDEQRRRKEQLQVLASVEAVTKDGTELRLAANISSVKELEAALKHGAQGVGLFRTEFLYMDRNSAPDEDEQYEVYRLVAEKAGNHSVVIRTLDIGGDKPLDYLQLPEEENPFLGYRAIRISLDWKELFKTQLTAILRASAAGNIKVMYPMISSWEGIGKAEGILMEAWGVLVRGGLSLNPPS
ncbi:phosphoenolpyruvate--protein phosphotransferase, partial [Paenibacillus sp. 28ISP30-2]|nr:phosphoenolpyruvate--protein phosphotransferase [Paenibacillus sp. 28ISP30-2]